MSSLIIAAADVQLLDGIDLSRWLDLASPEQFSGAGKDSVSAEYEIIQAVYVIDACLEYLVLLVEQIKQGALANVELLAVGH